MKEFFEDIKGDKTITLAFFISIFLIIIAIIYIIFSYGKLPPFIPIFNQLPWGEQRLGNTLTIFIPVLIVLLILVINIFITSFTYRKIPLVARMLTAISLLCGILMLLFVIKTIILIT